MVIALMAVPPVVVRVEGEALVVRDSLEATAVAVDHCGAEISSPCSLVVHLPHC